MSDAENHSKEISQSLEAAYQDPRRFGDPAEYKKQRRYHIKHALICIVLGVIFLAIMLPGDKSYLGTNQGRGGLAVLIVGFGLPLYGLYELVTIGKIISRELRAQLVWLNPELKALAPTCA